MNYFTKYKIKVSLFIDFVIFLMIFFTWGFFIYFNYITKKNESINKLNFISKKIEKLNKQDFTKIISTVKELSLNNIVNSVIWSSDNSSKTIKSLFWTKFINVYNNNYLIFSSFDENSCNNSLICKKIKKENYTFLIWVQKNNLNLKYSLIKFTILAFFISILFSPLIYWIVWKLTKPIELNFEFMKNFVNNAWHELKTPLANINLASQILYYNKEYDEELIKQIKSESKRLSNLIDTLLQISTLSKFQNKEEISLSKEINKIIKKYNKDIKNKNIKLVLDLENVSKEINKEQFDILFSNLLSNAIKYNKENWIIKIILRHNKLIIENTWEIIPEKEKNKIFDLFYRLKKDNNWYWLWLSMVKRIIQINKWKIKIDTTSNTNKFIITF